MGFADVASSDATREALSSLISTTPADGAVLSSSESPRELSLRVSPVLAATWTNSLVDLDRIESDGVATSILSSLPGTNVSVDMAAGVVTISLAAPLAPGRYAFILHPGFQSQILSQRRWDATKDQEIAEFQVESDPAAEVKELGVLGSSVLSTTGTLANAEGSQDVYHFQLAAGQPLWQVTLQVDAGSIGSSLISDLAVYDQSGNLVKNVQAGEFQPLGVSTDKPNPSNDPYLFLGLAPGDYYVVVSKAVGLTGGNYRLGIAADPAQALTTVTGFTVDHYDGTATGFTLTFSAPLDPNTVWQDSLKVVDSDGQTYALRVTRADYGLQRIGFTFNSAVPAGDYSVVVSGDRPLADLVGRTPIALGLPAGTLARFTLSTAEAPTTPPTPGLSKVLGGGAISLPAGTSIDVPIVVDQNALLTLRAQTQSGSLRIEVIDADGVHLLTSGSSFVERPLSLASGNYTLRLTAVGNAFLSGSWSLVDDALHDSPVADAVGSAGVLAIRLGVDRSATLASAPLSTPPITTSTTSTPTPSFTSAVAALASSARSSEMGPSPWAVGSSATSPLVGRPGANGDGVPSINPSVPGSLTAVASAAQATGGTDTTINALLASTLPADDGLDRGPAGAVEELGSRPTYDDSVARAETNADLAAPDAEAEADDAALLQADRVLAALQGGFRWLFDGLGEAAETSPVDKSVTVKGPEDVVPSSGQLERSSLDLPVGVLFVTASTVHLRRAALRWWRRHRGPVATTSTTATPSTSAKPLFRGPRRMTPIREHDQDRVYGPRRG